MSNIGVISEFNPFHNGHKYLLDEAKNRTGVDTVVSLMGGNFMQRGIPAIADKYTRAEISLIGGVDVVFELPVIYATGSARDFACGAVSILDAMKVVDYLAFGVEDDEINLYSEIADILCKEPDQYKELLNHYLTKGLSYPASSEKAIIKMLGEKVGDIIAKPNNILAISYITALKMFNSHMMPILIKRTDNGYHNLVPNGNFYSASAIRTALLEGKSIKDYIPKGTEEPIKKYLKGPLPDASWLTPFIASRIIYDRNLPPEISELENVLDMTPELLNRLRKAPMPVKYVELQDYLKTKNLTMTRVSRALLHMVLGIRSIDRTMGQENGYSEYVNLLAMKADSSSILRDIEEKSSLKIINKKAHFSPETECGQRMWQLDKLATDLYNQMIYQNMNIHLRGELTSSVRIIK